jgi:short-subunit dehydrogenase
MLKFPVIVLVDADAAALAKQKEELLQKRSKDGIEVVVHSIEYDYSRESQEADAMIVSRLNRIVERSGLQISILINNMSTTKDEKRDEKTLLRKAINRV